MADPTQYMFSHQEVAEALMKQQGIHTGFWSIAVEFQFGAAVGGPAEGQLVPTAFTGVARIGLERTDSIRHNLCFDAAVLNPKPVKTKAK